MLQSLVEGNIIICYSLTLKGLFMLQSHVEGTIYVTVSR